MTLSHISDNLLNVFTIYSNLTQFHPLFLVFIKSTRTFPFATIVRIVHVQMNYVAWIFIYKDKLTTSSTKSTAAVVCAFVSLLWTRHKNFFRANFLKREEKRNSSKYIWEWRERIFREKYPFRIYFSAVVLYGKFQVVF